MKKLVALFVVSLLVVNVLIACGGMSPQPAPGDFDTDVPTLPSDDPGNNGDNPSDGIDNPGDNGDTSNDNICPIHDRNKPCEICAGSVNDNGTNNGDNNNNNDKNDLQNLGQDLPPSQQNKPVDKQYVDIVL